MGRQEQPKRRNQVVREMLERGGAGAGRHQVDHETAFQKGWRRSQKHKKSWNDQDFLDEELEEEFLLQESTNS